jgi:hypothetical protein
MSRDYRSAADMAANQKAMANDAANSDLYKALMQEKLKGEHAKAQQKMAFDLGQQGDQAKLARDMDTMQKLKDMGFGGRSIKAGEISVAEPDALRGLQLQQAQENKRDAMVEKLSKREEPASSALSSAKQLEDLTNGDGKGGVLSNPSAQFKSMGKFWSGIHSPAIIGLAETVGLLPKGAQEERAAFQAYLNDYAHKKYGARVTPEQMEREAIAHGFVGGGDPSLTAKAVRQRTGDIVTERNAAVAGYSPDVQKKYGEQYQNPLSGVSVFNDPGVAAVAATKHGAGNTVAEAPQNPSGGLKQIIGGSTPPAVTAGVHHMAGKTVKNKVTGQMGTIDAQGNFVPEN